MLRTAPLAGGLQASTQTPAGMVCASSSGVKAMALLEFPHAGQITSNRRRDSSKHTSQPSFTPKGQTPPAAWLMRSSASSAIFLNDGSLMERLSDESRPRFSQQSKRPIPCTQHTE